MSTVKYVLVGPHAGKTMSVQGFHFSEGACELTLSDADHAKVGHYLSFWQAYPEGPALEQAQAYYAAIAAGDTGELKEKDDGNPTAGATGEGDAVLHGDAGSEVQDHGGSAPDAGRDGHGGPEAGDTGMVTAASDGSGATDQVMGVQEALNNLDPTVDEHWTKGGLPNLAALSKLVGRGVSRDEVESLRPGFTRENRNVQE